MNSSTPPTITEVTHALADLPEEVLVVTGTVDGNGHRVDDLSQRAFTALASRAQIIYRSSRTWAECSEALEALPGRRGQEVALVTACVVLGGVAHTLTGVDPALAAHLEANRERDRREEAAWEAEQAAAMAAREAEDARLTEVTREIESTYPDRLLADEDWLRSKDQRGRERTAREWARAEYPDVAGHQRTSTAILNAVATADDRREREVLPARLTAFEANLAAHGQAVAATPGYALATTKHTREAHTRRYVIETDPLVPPAIVLDRLIAAAAG